MIPFNKPYLTGNELKYISEAHVRGQLAGDGAFTRQCNHWLVQHTGCYKAMLTHSCTAALEMTAILADIKPGDEVIMPSYTFVSTANAFVLRGGVPVFVDIRQDTLNLDESLIEAAITPRTKAIVPVHYAGFACEMDTILDIARSHKLLVIEDAAQGTLASYKGRALGSIGDLGCLSFHETKNVTSGEGGALLINNPEFAERAEVIREKGTNRDQFFRGQVNKYTWVDVGSSYLPGEIIAAFLWAQLEEAQKITDRRLDIWERYHLAFAELDAIGRLQRPKVSDTCKIGAHMYYLLLRDLEDRTRFIEEMKLSGINCVFHYVPLHLSPAGRKYCKANEPLPVTEKVASLLIRLPLWASMNEDEISRVIDSTITALPISTNYNCNNT